MTLREVWEKLLHPAGRGRTAAILAHDRRIMCWYAEFFTARLIEPGATRIGRVHLR